MNFKKIIITSLVGSIGMAVLGLSLSLAWYATSENLYIDTLVINVAGDHDLKISTKSDLNSFKESVQYRFNDNKNDLNDAGLFTSVSSMFKSNWLEDDLKTEPEFYYYDNTLFLDSEFAPKYATALWGFFSQHIFLYSATTTFATIDSESFFLNPLSEYNSTYAYTLMQQLRVKEKYETLHPDWTNEQIHDDIKNDLDELAKCMRVGLFDIASNKFYIIDPYKEGETYLGGRADLFLTKQYDSYINPNDLEKYEIIYGEVNGRDKAVYLDARDTEEEIPEDYSSFNSRTEVGVHPFDLEASLENGLSIKKEDSMTLVQAEEQLLIPVKAGTPKELVLTVYMEGWDTDCTNQHMGAGFDLHMEFKISEERQ